MEKKQTDSVQNRFTAYLMAAVANKRISYFEQRNRYKEREYIQVDDVLGDKFPQELSRLIPVPLRGQLVRVLFRTVFLDVFKDLVVGQCFLPCGSKEHII